MSQVSSAPSPLVESVSPLMWGSSPVINKRSTPITIVKKNCRPKEDSDSDDEVGHSFQQLVLESQDAISRFRVGSLPSGRRRTHSHNQLLFGTSLPAAPVLTSTRHRTANIPPISLTEGGGMESSSPSYGSLRESQIAGRFLDGPSSYRDSSGQIKWHHKVRFQLQQVQSQVSLEDSMQESREQQQEGFTPQRSSDEEPFALASTTIHSSQKLATSVTLHDQDSFLHKDEHSHLSTSLTGLELLQRGLSTDVPDVANMSSASSSYVTYDAPNVTYDAPNDAYDAPNDAYDAPNDAYDAPNDAYDPLQGEYCDRMPPLPDEEEDDDIVFDLDME